MKNRIVVTIAGESYTILSEESEEYVKKAAELVDSKIAEVSSNIPVSQLNAAVLAALSIADDSLKAAISADNMRTQMKSYLDDASRLRTELNEARRELARLKNGKR
ncbi:MAG: cell division protein ZapA [Clostridiales bacterium]|nr:cell division protein ZapA [Clostridiales bacterium]